MHAQLLPLTAKTKSNASLKFQPLMESPPTAHDLLVKWKNWSSRNLRPTGGKESHESLNTKRLFSPDEPEFNQKGSNNFFWVTTSSKIAPRPLLTCGKWSRTDVVSFLSGEFLLSSFPCTDMYQTCRDMYQMHVVMSLFWEGKGKMITKNVSFNLLSCSQSFHPF